MRYTTVIDISEIPAVWRSPSARHLYFYMCLRAGWHDDDRDVIQISIRSLAADSGLTVSATRCALSLLLRSKLAEKVPGGYKVLKWICQDPPTPRQKPSADLKQATKLNDQLERQIQEYQAKVMQAVRSCSVEELQAWLQELEEGRERRHYGTSIKANQRNIEWLRNIISQR